MINEEKKYLFIRIPKTASSTLRIALGEQNFSNFGIDNIRIGFSSDPISIVEKPVDQENFKVKSKYIDFLNFTSAATSNVHARYIEWNEAVDNLENYFTFSFVRNPWDWMVSQYIFLKKIYKRRLMKESQGKPAVKCFFASKREDFIKKLELFGLGFSDFRANPDSLSFDRYVESYFSEDALNKTQLGFLKNKNGEININYIGKFENLQQDWDELSAEISLNPIDLEPTNVSEGRRKYSDYYSSEITKNTVTRGLAEDIEYFGYEFGA